MIIEYRTTPINLDYLTPMWKEWWIYRWEWWGKMIWSKEVKKKVNKKLYEPTKEFIEFRDKYKTIKKNGLYDQSLVKNYNECVSEWLHKSIMKNLDNYIMYLEVGKKKEFALMPTTYINRKRYLDEWILVKDIWKKWIHDIFKDRELSTVVIDNVLTEIQAWEVKNKPKEITSGIVMNIIDYILTN